MSDRSKPVSVLMVCLGNICRSPMAEAALRHHAAIDNVELVVDSAGTGDWHVGRPPDPRAQAVVLRQGGIDISGLRARQVHVGDFDRFDHILAMDRDNLRDLRRLSPATSSARLSLLLDHDETTRGRAVADPYYGDDAGFETCWHQINAATIAFLDRLKR